MRSKKHAIGTALYMHPRLSEILEVDAADRAFSLIDVTVDSLVRSINVADGVKASLFTNILALVESAVEKVIAFSQYITSHEFFGKAIG